MVLFPNYGDNAFVLYGLGSYLLVGVGLVSVGYALLNIIKGNIDDNGNTPVPDKPFRTYSINSVDESDDYSIDGTEEIKNNDVSDDKPEKLPMKTAIGLIVIGAVILFLGGVRVNQFSKDFGNEPRVSTIVHAHVEARHSAGGKAGTTIRYYLEGKDGNEAIKLLLKGVNAKWVTSSISNKGTIVVTYYPNTGVIVKIERDEGASEYGYGEYNPSSSNNRELVEQIIQRNEEMLDTVRDEGVDGYINGALSGNSANN